jgi:hypothetical protein
VIDNEFLVVAIFAAVACATVIVADIASAFKAWRSARRARLFWMGRRVGK